MTKETIFLGLGSNLGDRLAFLNAAIQAISAFADVLGQSPIYETAPWGYDDQDDFLNQVLEVSTELSPRELLGRLKQVEQDVGRRASFQNGPREIDIDILLYGNQTIEQDDLSIPHPRLHERAFMLRPLANLAPDLVHPVKKKTVSELLKHTDQSGVKMLHG